MAELPKLKVAYTVAELAEMAGENRRKMRRLLISNGVKLHKRGARGDVVMVSQIRQCFPDLWSSLIDRIRLAS